ncbi:MAG: serine/threonine-protein kinase [Thermoanaerobaculia bacterium]
MATASFSLFDLAPNKLVLGRYRIAKASRSGGLSATFAAHDESSASDCELTAFPPALFESAAQANDYKKALEAWRKIEHPGVARVLDVLMPAPATIVMISEAPRGEPLAEWGRDHKNLPQAVVAAIGVSTLDALEAIHTRKLVHGDIKPATLNVAQGKGKSAKLSVQLVDGGVTPGLWGAKHLGDRTALIGTPFYAPVEQFGGESPDVASDVYNVAAVLFELATGVLPWPGRSFLEIFQAKLDKLAPSMKKRAPEVEVDPEFELAVQRGLFTDKRQRYQSAAEFKSALSPFTK